MPPAATFSQRVSERAVGLAANGRNAAGLTPSTFTKTPFTRTRPASTGTAAATTPSRRSRATRPDGSDRRPTTSTSACSRRCRLGARVPADDGSGLAATVEAIGQLLARRTARGRRDRR